MLHKISQVLTTNELTQIQMLLSQAQWVSGKTSAGAHAIQKKLNAEMDQSCASWKAINQIVLTHLNQHQDFQYRVLPLKVSAAFVARYTKGMAYGSHIDDPVMGISGGRYRADVAVTVFLNEPDEYVGGELIIETRFGPTSVKLAAGSAVAYPASSLHEVQMVHSGERIVAVMWVQSLIRDADKRDILADLDDARQALQIATPGAKVANSVNHAYMNLVRLWADC